MQVRVQAAPDGSAWGWELGFGLVWVGGTDNQGEEGKEGKEGRSCLLHLHLQVHLQSKCKCKYSYRTGIKTAGEDG